ncbi:hypothetical protein [Streptomyces sp. ID05-47C]|uniref:hypothetical protein n=1 Tax=Streptomyces sp. ID05-47C TaxID=3028665 RepID=UPI0029A37AD8|nr:hypothetical protein [Streptomyces sp. ID05-47C]MDX3568776.1 hypothetical protein [Streptomyces sp. ID05-47C]
MGERTSGGGDAHRRHAHPVRSAPDTDGHPQVEALLTRALRHTDVAPERERQAVAAFRAAREAGAHRARTRRRDDWRPRTQRHTVRSLRATLSVILASLTLGGVAVAAIGSAGSSQGSADDGARPTPSASAPDGRRAGPAPTVTSGTSAGQDRPPSAQDTEAQCRAYDQVAGRGKALDATAWQRLLAAAGGEENVTAYCAAHTASAAPAPENSGGGEGGQDKSGEAADPAPGTTGDPGNAGTTEGAANTGTAGDTGTAGNTGNNGRPEPEKTPDAKGGEQ